MYKRQVIKGQRSSSLHYAACFGRPAIASVLLRYGANPDLRDEDGKTPLDKARERNDEGHREVASILQSPADWITLQAPPPSMPPPQILSIADQDVTAVADPATPNTINTVGSADETSNSIVESDISSQAFMSSEDNKELERDGGGNSQPQRPPPPSSPDEVEIESETSNHSDYSLSVRDENQSKHETFRNEGYSNVEVDSGEPKGDPEMIPCYVRSLLPMFCHTYQPTMIQSVKKSSLALLKKLLK